MNICLIYILSFILFYPADNVLLQRDNFYLAPSTVFQNIENLEQLFDSVWKPTFMLRTRDKVIYDSSIVTVDSMQMMAELRELLQRQQIDEKMFVRVLLELESTKRKIKFHDRLAEMVVKDFMDKYFFIAIRPGVGQVEFYIDSNITQRIFHTNDIDFIVAAFTGAMAHEYGHIAYQNRNKLNAFELNGTVSGDELMARLEKASLYLSRQLLGYGREEILADVFVRALIGEKAYLVYIEQVVEPNVQASKTLLAMPFISRDQFLSFINSVAYYGSLYQSAWGLIAGGEYYDALDMGLVLSKVFFTKEDYRAIIDYYFGLAQAYHIRDGLISLSERQMPLVPLATQIVLEAAA